MDYLPDKVLVIRHGARLDETMPAVIFRDVDAGYDTPLTYGGFKQSQALGAYIAQLLLLPGNPDRRRKRIIIHSSPFTRCIQTSIGVAAGLAQVVPPTESIPRGEHETLGLASTIASPYAPITLRIDPWLGEWMTEQYFEHWDAALLRSSELVIRARNLLKGVVEAEGIRVAPISITTDDKAMTNSMSSVPAMPIQAVAGATGSTYHPPKPNHAVLLSDAIPKGYVAHARDACINFDETWLGLRDGGIYGERWSTFHARIGAGFKELLQWYLVHPDVLQLSRASGSSKPDHVKTCQKQDTVSGTQARLVNEHSEHILSGSPTSADVPQSPAQDLVDDITTGGLEELSIENQVQIPTERDEELIIILVTHAGGCNKLLHFLTQKPVLVDFPHSSLTLATKNQEFYGGGQLESLAKQYRTVLQASTDHLTPTARFRTIKDLSVADVKYPRQSRSSSRSNRRTTLTSISPINTINPLGLWGQKEASESGSRSASAATAMAQSGLWRPDGGAPIRRATFDHLDSLPKE